MSNQDSKMLKNCTRSVVTQLFKDIDCEHPLDDDVIKILEQLKSRIEGQDDDYALFRYQSETNKLWGMLLEKAIKCLRYYDQREPFINNGSSKQPKAYGIEDLRKYYEKYTHFERVLYGSSRYYRDHVIHVLRTWLSGIDLLTRNNGEYLERISIKEKKIEINLNKAEKISMWTLIALTHDLGYPLEKAKSIISITQDMLSTFITNPDISVDFAFHGVQNYMNDYVVRLMSSKMEERKKPGEMETSEKHYVSRLQSKYYFKFQKSLERNAHGILSTLIIYKLLTYFLESDYNINEDYYFDMEDCRQFYIRREILRAIASHTCNDVYQMYMGSFSFLLRICDDTQEWGRKNISELYVKSNQTYNLEGIELCFDKDKKTRCKISEKMGLADKESVIDLVQRFREQSLVYVTIFRDGQDTAARDFSFARSLEIQINALDGFALKLLLDVNKETASKLTGTVTYTPDGEKNKEFGSEFFGAFAKGGCWEIYDDESAGNIVLSSSDCSEQSNEVTTASRWRRGHFEIPLVN